MMCDLVSVILPIYNVEKYLAQAIESVMNQTHTALEIILVDDGSTDCCGEICDKYARNDARIKVIHQQNKGVAAARNTALDRCIGSYIVFVDPDDWINECYIEEMLAVQQRYDADMVECNIQYVKPWGTASQKNDKSCKVLEVGSEILKQSLTEQPERFYNICCARLYKKDLFANIRFPNRKIAEDEAVGYRILYQCNRAVKYSSALYCYRQNLGSTTRRGFNATYCGMIETATELVGFVLEAEPTDTCLIKMALKRALNKCLRFASLLAVNHAEQTYPAEYIVFEKAMKEFIALSVEYQVEEEKIQSIEHILKSPDTWYAQHRKECRFVELKKRMKNIVKLALYKVTRF